MRLASLIAAIVCLALAGCGKAPPTTEEVHGDWVAKVNEAITDPGRAQRVAEPGAQLIDEEQSMAAALKAAADRLAELNTDYTATSAQLMAATAIIESERKAASAVRRDVAIVVFEMNIVTRVLIGWSTTGVGGSLLHPIHHVAWCRSPADLRKSRAPRPAGQ